MIRSFRDRETGKVFRREFSRKFQGIAAPAKRKLDQIHAAGALSDLRAIPGNRFEALAADRLGQYSVRINDIVRGRRAITADTALRLARYFGTTPQFWTSLQSNYDLELAQDAWGSEISGRVRPYRAA